MQKVILPKVITKNKSKIIRESGCCFRSCGGVPCVSIYNNSENFKKLKLTKRIKKIK
jgi:hypothetical protein